MSIHDAAAFIRLWRPAPRPQVKFAKFNCNKENKELGQKLKIKVRAGARSHLAWGSFRQA